MIYFAKINENNIVSQVIVIPEDKKDNALKFISEELKLDGKWIETSESGKFRNIFAGQGYIYNEEKDIFISPQPKPWFVLNEDTLLWEVPYDINENTGQPLTEEEMLLKKIKSNIPNDIIYPIGE